MADGMRLSSALTLTLLACGGDPSPSPDLDSAPADTTPDTVDVEPDTLDAMSDLSDTTPADALPDLSDAEVETPAPIAAITALEAELLALPEGDRDAALTTWLDGREVPLTADTTAVFLWRGPATEVRLVGDASNWNAQTAPKLTRLAVPGVDVWWLAQTYERDARLDYKLVLDGGDWRLDPLNPRKMAGGFGPNSELAMPDYVTPADAADLTTAPAGVQTSHGIESTALGQSRTIYVYVPPGADVEGPRRLVIFHDGNDYRGLIRAPLILDRVVGSGDVGPLVAVFAPPTERTVEYNRNDAYVTHLAEEVVPFMRETYRAGQTPATTATIGPSFGGLIACYAAFTRPDVFGLAGCQSGAYSYDDDAFIDLVSASPKVDIAVYLVVGTYELAVSGDSTEGNLLSAQRRLAALFSAKGYPFLAEELPQGHSWGLWRDTLPASLRYLFGPR